MHPLNDAVDALDELLLGELLPDEPPDELLPHAAASSASTLSAAAAGMERLTESSYFQNDPLCDVRRLDPVDPLRKPRRRDAAVPLPNRNPPISGREW
jgi:hypothetical protein